MRFKTYFLVFTTLFIVGHSFSQTVTTKPAITHVSCVGGTNGSIKLNNTAGGGTPHTYTWQPGNTNGDAITGKGVGNYSVSIKSNPPPLPLWNGNYNYNIGYKTLWQNFYFGMVTNSTGDTLIQNRNPPVSSWLETANSANVLPGSTDGWVEYVVTNTGYYKIFGLLDPTSGSGWNNIDFALYLKAGGSLSTINDGVEVGVGTYAIGDVIRIERSGSNIKYSKNNTVFTTLAISTPMVQAPLTVRAALYSNLARFENMGCSFPSANISAGVTKTITCASPTVSLIGSTNVVGGTYTWTPGGSAANSLTTSVAAAGTYSLKITVPVFGCIATSTVAVVTNTTLPNISAGPTKSITCSISSPTLTGSSSTSGATFSWTPGGSAPTSSVTVVSSVGTYTLKVTDPVNGCSVTSTVAVVTNTALPNVSAGPTKTITCASPTVTLMGSSNTPGVTYSWTPGGATTATVNVFTTGTFTLKVTDPINGCSETSTVAVVPNITAPNISAGTNKTITCTSPTAVLTGSSSTSGVSYSWTPGGSTPTNSTTTVSSVGTYTLKVTAVNGCVAISTVSVISNTIIPDVNIVSSMTPTLGLTAYWPFNGNAQDYSGNANHGTVSNATLSTDRFGNANKAYSFNGTSSRIDVPHSSTVDMANGQDFTLAFWMKSNAGNVGATPISKSVYGAWSGYMILVNNTDGGYCNSAGQCSFYVAAGATGDACANNPISNDATNWYFVTGQYKASTNQTFIYVNSVLQTDIGSKSGSTNNTKKLSFGAYNDATNLGFFNGYLDDIRLYNRLLNQSEIDALYNESNNQVITCANPTAILTGSSSTSGVTYSWTPGGSTPTGSTTVVSSAGIYTIKVTDPVNGCFATSTVAVVTNTTLTVNAGSDAFVTTGSNVGLGGTPSASAGSGNYTYSWTPVGTYAPGSTASNPTVTVNTSLTYTLTVTDNTTGCQKTDEKLVYIIGDPYYFVLKKTLDAGYYNSYNNKIYFAFEEEYIDQNSTTVLNYKIVNDNNTIVPSVPSQIENTGDNRYQLDLSVLGLNVGSYYRISITNEKNEVWYARFKY